jgi:predicted nicotinamide N-methyase
VKLVEVGSGLGLVANAAAVFGAATAVATDCIIPEPKQRLLEVSSGRPVESVSWSRVDWHATDSSATTLKEFGPFDLIVGADIIYSKSLFLALAQTLGTLLRGSAPGAKCFLCNQIRRPKEEDEFFNKVLPMYGMVAQLSDDDGETSMLHVYAASQSSGVMDHDPQAEVLNAKIIKYTRLFKVQLANDLSSSSSYSVTEQGQCDGMYL